MENAGAIVGQRTLQWDLGMIQPGLCLRIGPSVASNSMLEFIMDPNHDRGDRYIQEEPSTGILYCAIMLQYEKRYSPAKLWPSAPFQQRSRSLSLRVKMALLTVMYTIYVVTLNLIVVAGSTLCCASRLHE